jgi:CrcB protein
MEKLAIVALGGAIGAVLRYLAAGWAGRASGELVLGTLVVNVAGSFAMGAVAVLIALKLPEGSARLAPFLMTGVLGGFTTFSAFSLDAFRLWEEGRAAAAAGYAGGSVVLSIAGLVAGIWLTRSLLA